MSENKPWAKCCVCGCPLTPDDYYHDRMIVEEFDNPYNDEVELQIYCSDCYNDLYGNDEEELEWLEDC